jgi:hypothetical protein
MQWYYSKNGTQLGPVEEGELRAKIASGEISSADLVWKEGMTDWLPSSKVPDLAGVSAGAPPAYSPPVAPSFGGTGSSPYTAPVSAPSGVVGPDIPNYLWQSIVVTILCCWPLGIPAIVYAAKVDGLKARGDFAGAQAASKSAKTWCSVAVGLGVAVFLIWILLAGLGAMTSSR